MKVVIVFAKAPVPGGVKTRLTPPFSAEQAAALYRAFAADSLAAAQAAQGAQAVVAYAAHEDWPDPSWLGTAAADWFPQEGADLGRRLAAATGKAFIDGADRVVVIGTDSPHLPPERIEEAFSRLAAGPVVLGPARDGGYYLIGLREPAPTLFDDIPWSGPKVLEATTARAAELRWPVHLLDPLEDIDDAPALVRMLAEVQGTSRALRTQAALAQLSRSRK
ncbi:MAG: TIGR04282 family arsenosugar biosynthesis glycosyltransferase [Elusimicrobia bacterium]|nr:TIGR04282 family arsenosugar biosynthesis glycosyltransferase [Elusimicrobiota bacterium]